VSLTIAPETLIEVGSFWTLALNRNQNLVGKTMVVANRRVESVTALEPNEWLDLHRQMARVESALDDLLGPDQYNYAFLMNADAQVHMHVVPRYRTERRWSGQMFTDPHFGELYGKEQRILPPADLAELASAIRARLAA